MSEQNDEKLRVILCRSGKLAETIEMEDSLDAMKERCSLFSSDADCTLKGRNGRSLQ